MPAPNNPDYDAFVERIVNEPLERVFPLAEDALGRLILWHYDQYPNVYQGNNVITLSMAMNHGLNTARRELGRQLALELDEC